MSHRLSRRTMLRGMGTVLALPWLDAMLPTRSLLAATAPAAKPPVRMAFLYVANGMHMRDWTPEREGADFDLKPILQPVAQYRDSMTMLSGLCLDGAWAHGDGGGDHARSVAAYLTGAHPKKTDGANIKNGVSVDQLAASRVGNLTRFGSLELGCEASATAGNCDSGYSCAYTSNISWRDESTPISKEVNPRAVFDRLFGTGDAASDGKARLLRDRKAKSVLDFVLDDAKALNGRLGSADQKKLDEYLYSVRDVERRIVGGDKLPTAEEGVPDYPRPAGVPSDFAEHLRMMFDMLTLALQTDSTRIISFMYTNDSSNRAYKNLDISEGHHDLSHHGRNEEKQTKIGKINTYHVEQLAYLLGKLRSVKEGDGTLLDNCMLMYGSGIADGDAHAHDDLPIALFGRGGGTIQPGRHLKFEKKTPLTNLYLSMLDRMGAPTDKLGDSTGRLQGLEG